jgi:hypothetical protein
MRYIFWCEIPKQFSILRHLKRKLDKWVEKKKTTV